MQPRLPPEADLAAPRSPEEAGGRLAGRLWLARLAVAWEGLWPLLILPVGWGGLFAALALMDVLPRLPGWLHGLALSVFAGGLGYLGWRVVARFRLPGRAEAARRLERDSGLAHQPLAVLDDRLQSGRDDPLAEALWRAHRRRMAAQARNLRVRWPSPGMVARDPFGLRAAVLLLLVIAAAMGGHDWRARLGRALVPAIDTPGLSPDAVEVWITPPAYTRVPPVLLRPDGGEAERQAEAVVPAGSTVLAVVTGGWGDATLVIDGLETPFQPQAATAQGQAGQGQTGQGQTGQRIETHVESGRRLEIRQGGRRVASWPIRVVADAMPSIAFAAPPQEGERGRLRLDLSAADDYGIARAWLDIHRIEQPDGPPLRVDLPVAGAQPRTADITSWHDLTAHPWAGLPVSVRPMAADALGQEGGGEPLTLVLPQRRFHHPVARALVEQRRLITEDRAHIPGAVGLLDRLAAEPDLLGGDLPVFLALRAARHALDRNPPDLAEVQDLLWNAALRLEDGDLAGAERELEEARRALEAAVDGEAPAAEVERLLDRFQQALGRYLEALAQRMAQAGSPPPQGLSPDTRVVTDDELAQMMETMRGLAATGARDALRQMLRDMNQLLSTLQTSPMPPPDGPAMRALEELDGLARQQQSLLDQTFRRAQQEAGGEGRPGDGEAGGGRTGMGSGAGSGAQAAQQGLRRALGDLMRQLGQGLGEVPAPLAEAEAAMGAAADDLGRGAWDSAAEAQAQAVQGLRQGARQALEQLGQAGGGGPGLAPRDPLGRPLNGFGTGDDGTTRIPDQSDIQRARQILDELRRRAGELNRPDAERDYLRRLLERF